MYIDYETSDDDAQTAQMLSLIQTIRSKSDAVIKMLIDRENSNDVTSNVIPETEPNTHQGTEATPKTRSDREEYVVSMPIPWQVRGQSRMKFQLVNNELQITLSRRRR